MAQGIDVKAGGTLDGAVAVTGSSSSRGRAWLGAE